jgi:hypothetical protein
MLLLNRSLRRPPRRLLRAPAVVACAVALAMPAAAQEPPAPAPDATESATRAPAPPAMVPAPDVIEVMMGAWTAEIPAEVGGTIHWQLELRADGQFSIQVTPASGVTETRSGTYQIDSRSVRLIFPGMADESDPNSTALNLSDARSLETYFYRLLGPNRLAFRPTLCPMDPCQWIAERVE